MKRTSILLTLALASLAPISASARRPPSCWEEEDCEPGQFCADCDGDGLYHCSDFSCLDCPELPCPPEAPYCADCDGDGEPHCSADSCGCTEPPPPSEECVDVPGAQLNWVAPGSDYLCKLGLPLSDGIVGWGQIEVEATAAFRGCMTSPGDGCQNGGSLTGSGSERLDLCGIGATGMVTGSASFDHRECEVCLEPPTYTCQGLECQTASAVASGHVTADGNFVLPFDFLDAIGGQVALRVSGGSNARMSVDLSERGSCGTCPNCTTVRTGAGPSATLIGSVIGELGPLRVSGEAGGSYDGTINIVTGSGECPQACLEYQSTAQAWVEARAGLGIPGVGIGGTITIWRYQCSGTWLANNCGSVPGPGQDWTCIHRWIGR